MFTPKTRYIGFVGRGGSVVRTLGRGGSVVRTLGLGGSVVRTLGLGGSVVRTLEPGGSVVRTLGPGGSVIRTLGLGGSVVRTLGLGGSVVRTLGLGGSVVRTLGLGRGFSSLAECFPEISVGVGMNWSARGCKCRALSTVLASDVRMYVHRKGSSYSICWPLSSENSRTSEIPHLKSETAYVWDRLLFQNYFIIFRVYG